MGDKRRSSKVYVTFHKEYVVVGERCIRLRDRRSGRWEPVLPNRLLGPLPEGELDPELVRELVAPRIGERLCLSVAGTRVVSTPVLAIEAVSTPLVMTDRTSGSTACSASDRGLSPDKGSSPGSRRSLAKRSDSD